MCDEWPSQGFGGLDFALFPSPSLGIYVLSSHFLDALIPFFFFCRYLSSLYDVREPVWVGKGIGCGAKEMRARSGGWEEFSGNKPMADLLF